jgi:hypothetical protein
MYCYLKMLYSNDGKAREVPRPVYAVNSENNSNMFREMPLLFLYFEIQYNLNRSVDL